MAKLLLSLVMALGIAALAPSPAQAAKAKNPPAGTIFRDCPEMVVLPPFNFICRG
jgi:hypothetical protein